MGHVRSPQISSIGEAAKRACSSRARLFWLLRRLCSDVCGAHKEAWQETSLRPDAQKLTRSANSLAATGTALSNASNRHAS